MALWKLEQGAGYGIRSQAPGHHRGLAVVIALAAAPCLALAWLVPPPLVLPALSMVSCLVAGCIAALACHVRAGRNTHGITLWDVAGAFALIWVGAGMLSEPTHVVELFEHLTTAK
jgi:hypothetical protein